MVKLLRCNIHPVFGCDIYGRNNEVFYEKRGKKASYCFVFLHSMLIHTKRFRNAFCLNDSDKNFRLKYF